MSYFFFALSILSLVSVLAWLYILFHPARPWDFYPVGEDSDAPQPQPFPTVCAIVPARNEAAVVPHALPGLLNQDYPGAFHVILVDDRSTDNTAEVARGVAAKLEKPGSLTVLQGQARPEGWSGKVWAMNQGAAEALKRDPPPEFILLTDADIKHAPNSLRRLVSESVAMKLGLNSRMARLRCVSPAERLLIPAFVYFFNLLYPMRRANNPNDPLAAAAGGCVLLSRDALSRLGGGFESIRAEIIDDVNLARRVKDCGLPIWLSLSRGDVESLREYPALGEIWRMVTRTAFTELKYSWLRLAGAMAGLALLFVVPLLSIVAGTLGAILLGAPIFLWPAAKGLIALTIMKKVYSPAVAFFGLPAVFAFTLPVAGVLYGCMTVHSALRHARNAPGQWREIQSQS